MGGLDTVWGLGAGTLALGAAALALLALVGTAVALARQRRLASRYAQLMRGTSGGNLEAILAEHLAQVRRTADQVAAVDRLAQRLEAGQRLCLQHAAIVRFNPFQDTGSDQSFAIALADARGDGLVLSSLHARGTTRMYAKPLSAWASGYSLTDEEKRAIEMARRPD